MIRGYRVELKPNANQRALMLAGAGTARFAYNWGLAAAKAEYEVAVAADQKPRFKSAVDRHKEWVLLKSQPEYAWIKQTSKCCGQEALRDLEVAFKKFFAKKAGFPRFKRKGQHDSFRLTGSTFLSNTHIQVPRLGRVRLKQKGYPGLPDGVSRLKLSQITISRTADRWYASFIIKDASEPPALPGKIEIQPTDIVGLDLGIKNLGICSNGTIFANPKPYRKRLQKLQRLQRSLSRKRRGSKNRAKAQSRLARCHRKIANIRQDVIHQMTTALVKAKPKVLVVESLRTTNMLRNHRLACSIADAAFGQIIATLDHKCRSHGIHLLRAPSSFPSTRMCGCCGTLNPNLKLSDREWQCGTCGTQHDRDQNAAQNLQLLGLWATDSAIQLSPLAVSSTDSNACDSNVGIVDHYDPRDKRLQLFQKQCLSMKQEFKDAIC